MDSGLRRRGLAIVGMIVGISLLIWAGVHNARERRLAMQQATEKAMLASAKSDEPQSADEDVTQPKLTGKKAPAFTLSTLDGKKVSLSDYKGHPVFVNFWATWCEPCKLEMPWLEEFSKKYAAQGLVVLGISTDDAGKNVVAGTVKKLGVTYPILLKNDKIEDDYDINYAPESFYVDKSGKVVIATAGIEDGQGGKEMIEANIQKLLAAGGQ